MKKQINLKFLDHSKFCANEHYRWPYYELIAKNFKINETDRPDYVIDLGNMYTHHWYDDCVKILFEQESNSSNFNTHDYIVGFDDLTFGDRYIRIPLFARWPTWTKFLRRPELHDEQLLNRSFCSAVISNSTMGDGFRNEFLERLCQYKPVAMGGV